jgi:hypothetical protein
MSDDWSGLATAETSIEEVWSAIEEGASWKLGATSLALGMEAA